MSNGERNRIVILGIIACLLSCVSALTAPVAAHDINVGVVGDEQPRPWQQQQPRITRHAVVVDNLPYRGFPGSVELLHRSSGSGAGESNHLNRRDRSSYFNGISSADNPSQNYFAGDNRNNINYYRRSRVNAEFATAPPPQQQQRQNVRPDDDLVPISVATTATKTVQAVADEEEQSQQKKEAAAAANDDNHNHDGSSDSSAAAEGGKGRQVAIDKRKLLLSNLHLFNGTDTKNLSDSQKMLLIQIADRVARYGENNLFRELANAQQKSDNAAVEEEGRANTATTKKAKPSKRPHAAVHGSATLSSSATAPTKGATAAAPSTTTKRQPLPGASSLSTDFVSVSPTKTSTKAKFRPNTNFTPPPGASVTPSLASQSLSTPSEAERKSTTVATSRHTKKPGSVEDIIYDYNVTASALIEALSQPNPTVGNSLLYHQKLHPPTNGAPAAVAGGNKQTVNLDANSKTQPQSLPTKPNLVKPTKYHYYPHNQHIYLLPECATQQVCNAVYVRLNYTQPLCACPQRYRDPCSASLNEDDLHTTKLIGDKNRRAVTLAKTCEATTEMKQCREPAEWSLLAVQNTRTGKSHYLVICRCPDKFKLEGPMSHDQPSYANLPGIRVFGMKCVAPSGAAGAGQPQRKKPTIQQHRIPPKQPGQSGYQYLHRPDHVVHASELPQHIQHHGGGAGGQSLGAMSSNGYGRSAADATTTEVPNVTEAMTISGAEEEEEEDNEKADGKSESEQKRQQKSLQFAAENNEQSGGAGSDYDNEPEFPWHKVLELQDALRWNTDN